MSTATLGFAIDSTPAARAATDLDSLVTAAGRTEAAAERMGNSVTRAVTRISGAGAQINQQLSKVANDTENLAKRIERALNVRATFGGAERGKDIAAYGQELDRLRGKFNPVFTVLNNYKATLAEIRQAQRLGAISSDEMTAAISRERQAALASVQALKNRQQAIGGGMGGNAGFRRQNLGYQAFDVGQGLASGIPAQMILAQQGPQIAQLYAGQGGIKALISDVGAAATAAVSAVGALPLALGVAGTAAVAYFTLAKTSAKSTDDVLEEHHNNILALGEAYGVAEQRAKSYSEAERAVASAATQGSLEELSKRQVQSARDLRLQFGSMQTPGRGGQAFFNLQPNYKPFQDAFNDLDQGIRSGRIEGEKFLETVSEIGDQNPKLEKFADNILKAAKQFLQINTEVSKTKDLLTQIGTLPVLDPLGTFSPQRRSDEIASRTPSQTQQRQARMDAYRQQTFARSAAEREAAARAAAAAQFDPNENPTDRENRIAMAGYEARLQAERQLQDAQRERAANLDRMNADQQNEIDLIGKTGGAAAALRKEYELISALKAEAARNGEQVDQAEIDAIKQKTAEYGKYIDLLNQRRFNFDINQQNSDARLSGRDRGIVTTLRQYGLPEDLNGNNAKMLGQQYDWQQAKTLAKDFGDAFSNELVSGSHDIGKAFLKGFESALTNEASKLWEKFFDGLGNIFADWLTGSKGGASSGSGVSSIASAVLGTAANDNMGKAPVTPVTRAPLGDIAAYAKAIQSIESGGNYGALGPLTRTGDRAYGAYQVMGANIPSWTKGATGSSLSPSEFLGNKSAQDAVFEKYFGASVSKYGNPQDAASVWFTGRPLAQGAGAADVLGTTGSGYVDKFNKALGSATENLGGFGNGLGKIGESLSSSFFPAAPAASGGSGGGGLFGWLSGLFGGFKPIGAQATLATSGGITGLFADGTNYAPGGMAIVGERGPELVNLPQGSQVFNTNRSAQMMGAGNDNASASPRKLEVHVHGGSGDEHVRELARQGAQEALYQDKIDQARGGFGSTQKKYNTRKG